MTTADEFKEMGNAALQAGNVVEAIEFYSKAIHADGLNYVYYSNRSAAHLKNGDAHNALVDSIACIGLNPQFAKGYSRKAAALHAMKKYDDSIAAYQEGLTKFPNHVALSNGLANVQRDKMMMMEENQPPAASNPSVTRPSVTGAATAVPTAAPTAPSYTEDENIQVPSSPKFMDSTSRGTSSYPQAATAATTAPNNCYNDNIPFVSAVAVDVTDDNGNPNQTNQAKLENNDDNNNQNSSRSSFAGTFDGSRLKVFSRKVRNSMKTVASETKKVFCIGVGEIKMTVSETRYFMGDVITGHVHLELNEPTKAKGLIMSLVAEQEKTVTVTRDGQSYRERRTQTLHDWQVGLAGGMEFTSRTFPFEVAIPAHVGRKKIELTQQQSESGLGQAMLLAQSAYQSFESLSLGPIVWKLTATLQIPWKINLSRTFQIYVDERKREDVQGISNTQ